MEQEAAKWVEQIQARASESFKELKSKWQLLMSITTLLHNNKRRHPCGAGRIRCREPKLAASVVEEMAKVIRRDSPSGSVCGHGHLRACLSQGFGDIKRRTAT
jgi:hypothetical protein